jgi:hypothetical protein
MTYWPTYLSHFHISQMRGLPIFVLPAARTLFDLRDKTLPKPVLLRLTLLLMEGQRIQLHMSWITYCGLTRQHARKTRKCHQPSMCEEKLVLLIES